MKVLVLLFSTGLGRRKHRVLLVSQDSGVVSLVWQNFQGNAYLDEEGWPRAL